MSHDVVATFSKQIRRHRNLQLFIKLPKEEEKKKKGGEVKDSTPAQTTPPAILAHVRFKVTRVSGNERESEEERMQKNKAKPQRNRGRRWKGAKGA